MFSSKRRSSKRSASRRNPGSMYRPPVHQTATGRHNAHLLRSMRQQSRRNAAKRVSFVGGFFDKFARELKNLTK